MSGFNIVNGGTTGFNFTQSTPSSSWSINHNLNIACPAIDLNVLINGSYEKIIPLGLTIVDNNNITVEWTQDFSGNARIS
jgi:hypothetical protein